MLKFSGDKKEKVIFTIIVAVAILVLWLVPTHFFVWDSIISDAHEETRETISDIFFLWYIGVFGLIATVIAIWFDKIILAFSGYAVYAVIMLLCFYAIFFGGWDKILIGTYLDLIIFIVISAIIIWNFKEHIAYLKANPTKVKRKAQIGDAEILLKYKQLLDAGAITQEEFEAKKKEIID